MNKQTNTISKKHRNWFWVEGAILSYLLAIFFIGASVNILIGLFEFLFFVFAVIAIVKARSRVSILKTLGFIGLIIFLGLLGFSELMAGFMSITHNGFSSIGMSGLGFVTLLVDLMFYTVLKERGERRFKDTETERGAYLKRKGELEAEKEINPK